MQRAALRQALALPHRTVVRRAVEPRGAPLEERRVQRRAQAAIALAGRSGNAAVRGEPRVDELDLGARARVAVRSQVLTVELGLDRVEREPLRARLAEPHVELERLAAIAQVERAHE